MRDSACDEEGEGGLKISFRRNAREDLPEEEEPEMPIRIGLVVREMGGVRGGVVKGDEVGEGECVVAGDGGLVVVIFWVGFWNLASGSSRYERDCIDRRQINIDIVRLTVRSGKIGAVV